MSSAPKNPLSRRVVLKSALAATAAVTVLSDGEPLCAAGASGRGKLPRVAPESVGVAPEAVLAFVDAVEEKVGGLHSFMLLRGGRVAAEGWWTPYAPPFPHMLYSLSKSFTSTAVGLAVAEGKLSVEDAVVSFFPDKLPAKIDENLAAMRVKHLLTMSTGHDKDATGPTTDAPDGDWVRAFLSLPVEHAPGSKFVYNSAATYMLSAIAQKRTGKRLVEYLKSRLFDPLDIQGQTWETCPRGIDVGGWGLNVRTEDIARFGQLYVQKGKWGDRRLVPAAWVAEATSAQITSGDPAKPSDWSQGYGYQFWRSRHGAFRGDGAFGQFCLVLPKQDAVLAVTSGVGDMQAILDAVWDHLLPGMSASGAAVTAKPGASEALRKRLAGLSVRAAQGGASSPTAERVSGKTYRFDANDEKFEAAVFAFGRDRATALLRGGDAGVEQKIACGHGKWLRGVGSGGDPNPAMRRTAARGAWTADDTYTITRCYVETPYVETITCRFSGDDLRVSRKMNVGFGPTERPVLVGRAV